MRMRIVVMGKVCNGVRLCNEMYGNKQDAEQMDAE